MKIEPFQIIRHKENESVFVFVRFGAKQTAEIRDERNRAFVITEKALRENYEIESILNAGK